VLAIRKLVALRAVSPFFPRLAAFWGAVLVSQIGLGLLSVYSQKSVPITVLHLGFGALLWVSGVLGAVAISRARAGVRNRESAPAAPSLAYSGGSR
jgi:heme A synthase